MVDECLGSLWSSGNPFSLYIYNFYIYLSLGTSIVSTILVVANFFGFIIAALVIFSVILFSPKSPVSCFVFWITAFHAVLWISVDNLVVSAKAFVPSYCSGFSPCSLQRVKMHSLWHRFHLWAQLNISLYTSIINKQI